ncbi:head completion protein, partial [Candidatus Woesearchaeota archaeon]|nr:head completion protein [Candidatus Woesearchaeota archaeon]
MKKYIKNKHDKQYIPKFPERYCGQYPIVCRSSWEEKYCQYLDYNNNVIEWSSEGHRIPYFDGLKGKNRIYYPDFYVMFKNRKKFIVEVKPEKDLRMPKNKGKKSPKTMMLRETTFLTNQAKFKAAKAYCKKLG